MGNTYFDRPQRSVLSPLLLGELTSEVADLPLNSQREWSHHGHEQRIYQSDIGYTQNRSQSSLHPDCSSSGRVSKYVLIDLTPLPSSLLRRRDPLRWLTSVVDTILVISHEKLSIDLSRLFPKLTVLRIPKSGGAVDLDEHYNSLIQAFQIRSYFYGEPKLPPSLASLPLSEKKVGLAGQLTPYSFQIGWETLTIVRVGEGMSILLFPSDRDGGR